MKMNDAFSYEVKHNERITIKVTPRNFLDSLISVRTELDGAVLPAEPNTQNQPTFKFTAIKSPGDIHTVMMEFTFVAGSPDDAQYAVAISGQNDQGCPCGFTIEKDNADKSPDIEFDVV